MRRATFAFLVLGATAALAQRSLNPIGTNGNIVNPGLPLRGPSPVVRGPAFGSMPAMGGGLPTLGGGLPTLNGGLPALGMQQPPIGSNFGAQSPVRGFGMGGGRTFGGGSLVYVPMPVYGGAVNGVVHNPPPGQYDPIFGGYNPGVYSQPNSGYVAVYPDGQPLTPTSPTVIINQNFQPETVRPVLHDYTNVQLPEPGRGSAPQNEARPAQPPQPAGGNVEATIYLIAMKDHTIYPALAYWVENDTLHYVTMNGSPNRVSLSLVDRDLSIRLNDERGLPFRVPQQ
ncbi:MAG: hypothetical protein ABL967_18085 [Bryobacteraceae bacterium]